MNAVLARLVGTGIRRSRTTVSRELLGRRVADVVAWSAAATALKYMEQPEPLLTSSAKAIVAD